jgi:hypothetical protein
MKTTTWMAAVLAAATLASATLGAQAEDKKPAASAKAEAQRAFATPEEAVTALVDAVRADSAERVLQVMGPSSKSWLLSGDKVADAAEWKKFLAAYDRKNSITREGDAKAVLNAGDGDWSFPAPIVKQADKWVFDSEAGREEVLNRRVGRNELDTVQTLLAVVDAQREYAAAQAQGAGLAAYAVKFGSSPGKKDGLYWPTKPGEPESPLGPLIAAAVQQGYGKQAGGGPATYHGYHYRMLTSQGKDATGGAFDYMVRGKLFGGFAVVAWPASYGNSGVLTFIVNHEGVVYAKNLGPGTSGEATAMKSFNPDKSWTKLQ